MSGHAPSYVQVFAIVRQDRHRGLDLDPDDWIPPLLCNGECSYKVKEVVMDQKTAIREVARLNGLRPDDTRYFWMSTHLFPDGGSHGTET